MLSREEQTERCARVHGYCACAKHSGPACVQVPEEPEPEWQGVDWGGYYQALISTELGRRLIRAEPFVPIGDLPSPEYTRARDITAAPATAREVTLREREYREQQQRRLAIYRAALTKEPEQ